VDREHARELIPAFVVETLDTDDRLQVEALVAIDPEAAQLCDRLGGLLGLAGEPLEDVSEQEWRALQARLGDAAGEGVGLGVAGERPGGWTPATPGAVPALFDERYLLLAELGRGGMGVVYRALDQRSGEHVAVKLYMTVRDTPRWRDRLERELRPQIGLRHPNLLTCVGWGFVEGAPYAVFPLLESGTALEEQHGRGRGVKRWDPAEAAGLIGQAGRGVAAAHREGLLHRDLKPSNLWVEPDGQVHVLGLEEGPMRWAEHDMRLTGCGAAIGTPFYLSPEALTGRTDRIDERADVYALGQILYELLTGRLAFRGAQTQVELFRQKLDGWLDDPLDLVSDLPPGYREVLGKALAREPEHRYRYVEQFLADLDAVGRGEAIEAAAAPPWRGKQWLGRRPQASPTSTVLLALTALAVIALLVWLSTWG
jgi:serine/threonine protein kinase